MLDPIRWECHRTGVIGFLLRQRGDEFETKAETVFRTDDRGDFRRHGRIELELKQVARVQQDTGIEDHAALTHLGAASFDYGRRKAL